MQKALRIRQSWNNKQWFSIRLPIPSIMHSISLHHHQVTKSIMTPTINTFDKLEAYAEANFPNAFNRLPSPKSFHIQVRQGCTCFRIGKLLDDPQGGPVSLHFRRNGVCKHETLGNGEHILDTPFDQMAIPEARSFQSVWMHSYATACWPGANVHACIRRHMTSKSSFGKCVCMGCGRAKIQWE